MGFTTSASELWLSVALLAPALLALPLLLGLGALLARLLRRPAALVVPAVALLLAGLALLGGSLAHDLLGRPVVAEVASKRESVELRRQGDWRHHLRAELRFETGSGPAQVALDLEPQQYDRLSAGGAAELRALPIWRSLTAVSLAETTTATRFPWAAIAAVAAALALGLAALRSRSRAVALALGAAGLAAALTLPASSALAGRLTPAERPLRAEATVRAADLVEEINPLPCRPSPSSRCARRGWAAVQLPQPYTVAQVALLPQGAAEPVLAVASVDAGSPPLQPGDTVTVAYAAAHPRDAQIVGAGQRHQSANTPAIALQLALPPLAVLALIGWASLTLRRRRAARARP